MRYQFHATIKILIYLLQGDGAKLLRIKSKIIVSFTFLFAMGSGTAFAQSNDEHEGEKTSKPIEVNSLDRLLSRMMDRCPSEKLDPEASPPSDCSATKIDENSTIDQAASGSNNLEAANETEQKNEINDNNLSKLPNILEDTAKNKINNAANLDIANDKSGTSEALQELN